VAKEKSRLFLDELAIARGLRRRPTDDESKLWRHLRGRRFSDVKFRRQHPIGPYIVDFFCVEANLAIELDGGGHGHAEKVAEDAHRTLELHRLGARVLRFWNKDVFQNTESVLKMIAEAIETPSP